ncbi:MAG: AtpZ/AtpI family protein [Rhodospirillales bacterium]|nr:AtpZ/AtpI family protein [Rhodospirillales bacterium]
MGDPNSPPSLGDFDKRLRAARKAAEPPEAPVTRQRELGLAYRVAIEMVVGLAVGAGIGWVLDGWLGTRPFLMVAMLFMGFAAGMMNAYRTSRRIADEAEARDRKMRDGDAGRDG